MAPKAANRVQFPIIVGHELIGTVVAVGPGEKKWKVGDRVGGPWHGGHDGSCISCNRGFFQTCVNEEVNGITRNGGCKLGGLLAQVLIDSDR